MRAYTALVFIILTSALNIHLMSLYLTYYPAELSEFPFYIPLGSLFLRLNSWTTFTIKFLSFSYVT